MWKDNKGYLIFWKDGKNVKLHRYVWEQANGSIPDGYDVHHKNEIKDDNRIENLELKKHEKHSSDTNLGRIRGNKAEIRTDNTSSYKGVSFDKSRNKWLAYIHESPRTKHIGRFETADAAARAYDIAALKYFGDDCFVNFPQDNLDSENQI